MNTTGKDKAITKKVLAANGWSLEHHYQGQPFSSCDNAFYVFDNTTGFVYLTSLAVDFSEKTATQLEQVSIQELAFFITNAVHKLQREKQLTVEDENVLAIALNFYIKRTQSYVAWKAQASTNQKMHAIISIYGKPGNEENEGMLRPIMINSDDIFIHPEDVIVACVKTRDMDQKNHPEWFEAK